MMLSAGMWSLATLAPDASHFAIVWRLIVCGAGFGLFQAPNMKAIMSNAPADRSGGASGIVAISRLLGQTCGAALVAQCFHLWQQQGPDIALWLGCICAALGCVFSAMRLKSGLPRHDG
jgi:DHA2 family multidrug resistance protein-like MFS transporter